MKHWFCKLFGHKNEIVHRFIPAPNKRFELFYKNEQEVIRGKRPFLVEYCHRCHTMRTYTHDMTQLVIMPEEEEE